MRYDRTIVAYHGCDAAVAARVLAGEPLKPSANSYDWLGKGAYFWEFGADRALRFAEFQKTQSRLATPTVIGALIQLGNCFDLMDTKFTDELKVRCAFVEGAAAFPGSGIRAESHVQICIRNPACILGVFRPQS